MIAGIVPSLAEAGKIKIGRLGPEVTSRKGTTFRPPVKLDHFLVTTTRRDGAGDLEPDEAVMAELRRLSGDPEGKVREIPIVLHSDEIDEVFPTQFALYAGKKLVLRGDGRGPATEWETAGGQRTGQTREIALTPEQLLTRGAKPNGVLHCSIALPGTAVAGAVHKWRTTSAISVQRMLGSLIQVRQVVGGLTGVPLTLCLRPVQVSPAGAPSSVVYCCHVELRARDLAEVQRRVLEARKTRDLVAGGDYRALIAAPAADEEPEDEQAAVAAEFYPEADAETGEVRPAPTTLRDLPMLEPIDKATPAGGGEASCPLSPPDPAPAASPVDPLAEAPAASAPDELEPLRRHVIAAVRAVTGSVEPLPLVALDRAADKYAAVTWEDAATEVPALRAILDGLAAWARAAPAHERAAAVLAAVSQ